MDKNILKKQDNTYKLIITPELEEKIRFLCARFPNNEYSGVLFYDYTGRFEDNSLVLTAKDFCLMDYGSATYTEFDKSAEICNYMIEHDLLECQQGLMHSHDQMSTFFSGTDLGTLQEEGSDMNNFLSLIVNNAGQYTAAITRKVKHIPHVTEVLEYDFFGEETINIGRDEYDAIESYEIEYFFLNIEKPTVSIGYTDLFSRIEEISKDKSKITNIKREPHTNIVIEPTIKATPLYKEANIPFSKVNTTVQTGVDTDESIDYNKYKFNETDLNSITKQLLIGSPIFTPKDLNEWVQKMPTVFSKRFGEGQKGLENYRAFIGYFVEFLVTEAFDENLAEEGYLEDSQMAICAYGVLQKLHTFKTNSFIEVIEDEVERFII
nr:MAG TPA: Ubiquitin-like protein [Bacteriophage sp.]